MCQSVLMGQRGARAAFMPSKFVFPGGAVDACDAQVALATPLAARCAARLTEQSTQHPPHALAAAAIRELWEETGLILGQPDVAGNEASGADHALAEEAGPSWARFAATGHAPVAHPLQFVFRAITPPGRPRRFDARFFLVDAGAIANDPDDFSAAGSELAHLQWVPLARARHDYDLPFITEVVLAEVAARLHEHGPPASVPFFRNDDEASLFLRLRGRAPGRAD